MPNETDHDAHDGCLCGLDHADHVVTDDAALPAAVGGVQGDPKPRKRKAITDRTALAGEP